jgi:hypothetical protein
LWHGSPGTLQTCGLLFFPPAFFWCFLPCSPLWCGGEMRKGARGEKPPPPPTAQRRPWNGVSGLALVGRDELGCPDLLCARYPGLPAHSIWVGQIGARRSHDATCDQRQSQLARVSSLSSSLRTRPDPCSDARPSGGRPRAPCFHARATAFRNRCGPASAILVPWAHRRMSRSLEVLAARGDNGHSPPCFGWPEV